MTPSELPTPTARCATRATPSGDDRAGHGLVAAEARRRVDQGLDAEQLLELGEPLRLDVAEDPLAA